MKKHLKVLCIVILMSIASSVRAIDFDWAVIGNAGNNADDTGYGAVAYQYSIATTEVTNAQYVAFLNAVATTDTYGLYSNNMGTYGGITQSGLSGSYTYSLKDDDEEWANRPVSYVSWYDTLRFANWLQNGQLTGVQDATTTEYGAYDMSQGASVVRLEGATYWLPSEDEWYKAAFYNPETETYYDYATGSDNLPVQGIEANYKDGIYVDPTYYSTEVGVYDESQSPYGTYDQNGNMWEWNEALISSQYRGLRGGSWHDNATYLPASYRHLGNPNTTGEDQAIGFRVASFYTNENETAIPEPMSIGLLLLSLGGFVMRKVRRN